MERTTSDQILERYLMQKDPEIEDPDPRPKAGSRVSTKNLKYPTLVKSRVVPWSQFTLEALQSCFGGRIEADLSRSLPNLHHPGPISEIERKIKNEGSLSAIVGKHHQNIVNAALAQTSFDILEQKVNMVKGDQTLIVYADNTKFESDWAGVDDVPRRAPPASGLSAYNILPGDNKTSWNWSTEQLLQLVDGTKIKDPKSTQLWPLRQIAYYCIKCYARYGYIITDKELFVVRIGINSEGRKLGREPEDFQRKVFKRPFIEYASVPWNSEEATTAGLRITYTLWVLHLLAANDGYLQAETYAAISETEVISPGARNDQVPPRKRVSKKRPKMSQQPDVLVGVNDVPETDDIGSTTESSEDPLYSQQSSFVDMPDPRKLTNKRKRRRSGQSSERLRSLTRSVRRDTLSP